MKRLEDFPKNKNAIQDPLYIVYNCVTFSELHTFDLMRLLHSFRRHNNDAYEFLIAEISHEESLKKHITKKFCEFCNDENKEDVQILLNTFKSEWQLSWNHNRRYLQALKKELATRKNLTPHEKKGALAKSFS